MGPKRANTPISALKPPSAAEVAEAKKTIEAFSAGKKASVMASFSQYCKRNGDAEAGGSRGEDRQAYMLRYFLYQQGKKTAKCSELTTLTEHTRTETANRRVHMTEHKIRREKGDTWYERVKN